MYNPLKIRIVCFRYLRMSPLYLHREWVLFSTEGVMLHHHISPVATKVPTALERTHLKKNECVFGSEL